VSITIPVAKVSGSHTDFTVILEKNNFPSEMFDADGSYPAKSDGGDLRFCLNIDGTSELARDIRNFTIDNDPANGIAEVAVKIPSLSGEKVFYCFYNNPSASDYLETDTYGAQNAYKSDYKLVLPMHNVNDRTSNNNDMELVGSPSTQAGQIHSGYDLNGTSQYLKDLTPNSLGIADNFTASMWIKLATGHTSYPIPVCRRVSATAGGTDWAIDFQNESMRFYIGKSGAYRVWNTANSVIELDALHHVVITYDSTNGANFYYDSVEQTISDSDTPATIDTGNDDVYVGYGVAATAYFKGILDEIWVLEGSSSPESQNWITTVYNNQSNTSAFATPGTPQHTSVVEKSCVQLID
jgi:hypothetical protein